MIVSKGGKSLCYILQEEGGKKTSQLRERKKKVEGAERVTLNPEGRQ